MTTIASERIGSGTPVVLIHGLGHRRQGWFTVPARLADRGFEAISVDLPGFGESPRPTGGDGYSMASTCEQLERWFADQGIERPHVVGNSLGGQIALELAARGSIASCVAVSPAGFYAPGYLPLTGGVLGALKIGSYAPQPVLKLIAGSALTRKLTMGALYTHAERVTPQAYLADTHNLRTAPGYFPWIFRLIANRYTKTPLVPTAVLWGTSDRVLLHRQARTARKRLPDATHRDLVGSGHCAQLDDPEAVVAAVELVEAQATGRPLGQREAVPA